LGPLHNFQVSRCCTSSSFQCHLHSKWRVVRLPRSSEMLFYLAPFPRASKFYSCTLNPWEPFKKLVPRSNWLVICVALPFPKRLFLQHVSSLTLQRLLNLQVSSPNPQHFSFTSPQRPILQQVSFPSLKWLFALKFSLHCLQKPP